MRTIEASGKTVEEALSSGLKQLGVDISAVTHEVLDKGSPGLFGMFGRLAKVRITVAEEQQEDDDFAIEMPTLSLNPEQKSKPQESKKEKKEKSEKKDAPKPAKAEKKDAPKDNKKDEPKAKKAEAAELSDEEAANDETEKPEAEKPSRPRRERSRKDKKPKTQPVQTEEIVEEPAPAEPAREFPPLDVDALSEDGKKAYEFILGITRLMQVDVEIRMLEEENQIFVDISGDTLGVLIGRRGDTLDAIQYLTSLTVNKDREEYLRVTIDVEHYRAKREETLRKLAVRMANRARKSGRRVVLEPMNPYERRVLHSALQNNPYVQTHSEGEEPYRRVIITLK